MRQRNGFWPICVNDDAIATVTSLYLCTSKDLLPKGQSISKCFFGMFNSPKKRTKKFDFTTNVPQVELFLFVLWENWRMKMKKTKKHFEINWPLPRVSQKKRIIIFRAIQIWDVWSFRKMMINRCESIVGLFAISAI